MHAAGRRVALALGASCAAALLLALLLLSLPPPAPDSRLDLAPGRAPASDGGGGGGGELSYETLLQLDSPALPRVGKLVGVVSLPSTYRLEFTVRPWARARAEAEAVVQLTSSSAGFCCEPGDRAPLVLLMPDSSSLGVFETPYDMHCEDAEPISLPLGAPTRVQLDFLPCALEVRYNGSLVCSAMRPARPPRERMMLFVGATRGGVANASVSGLALRASEIAFNHTRPIRPARAPGGLVGTVYLPAAFELGFVLTPRGAAPPGAPATVIEVSAPPGAGGGTALGACCPPPIVRGPRVVLLPRSTALGFFDGPVGGGADEVAAAARGAEGGPAAGQMLCPQTRGAALPIGTETTVVARYGPSTVELLYNGTLVCTAPRGRDAVGAREHMDVFIGARSAEAAVADATVSRFYMQRVRGPIAPPRVAPPFA